MSREKQIEELTNELIFTARCGTRTAVAEHLYDKGWHKQEWISVDERLPEEEVPVIVYKRNNDIFGNMESAYLYKGKWVGTIGEYVTHWMPLPEAPKMKGGAE